MQIKLLDRMCARRLCWASAVVLAIAGSGVAETGMGLVVTTTTFQDLRVGAIRRIDFVNNAVTNTTDTIGKGTGPRFSLDGQKFCFLLNGHDTVVIANIDGGVIRRFPVVALPNDGGGGTLSWANSGIWVGVDGSIVLYDTNGTFIRKYNTLSGDKRGMVSHNEITAGGVNTDSWFPIVYNMRRNNRIRPDLAVGNGCSVCPNPSGTLLTNNLTNSPYGSSGGDGIHRQMRTLDSNGTEKTFYFLRDIVPAPFNGNNFHADMQTWSSNSDSWILIPVGLGNNDCPSTNCSPCIYNIATSEKYCLHDNNAANGTQWQPFDYYSGWAPGNTNPVLQLSSPSVSFAADSGAANPPTQTITASTSSGTLAGLTVSGAKSWLTVTPAATSGARITITNSVNIAGLAPATYLDTITVNTSNAGSKTYAITLTVRRPPVVAILTSLTVSPAQYTAATGSSVNFLATCKDQSGNYFTTATIAWNASGGGTFDQYGRFTANSTVSHGPHRIITTATAGSVTLRDTAWLMVSRAKNASVHKLIDCGTNSLLAAGWQTDDAYDSAGTDYDLTGTITTTGVPAAAPANVYKSVRRGNPHAYKISGVPSGFLNTVRMHLVDWKDTTRLMSYSILGANVLRDFRISTVAGGANRPLILDFTNLANDTIIPISCSAASGDVFEAGFEIIQNFIKPVTLLSPMGGTNQRFTVGQAIPVQFRNDTASISQMYIELSINGGQNYINFSGSYGIFMSDMRSTWGNYNWTIPDSVGDPGSRVSTVSARCKIRIRPYNNMVGGSDNSDSTFAIDPKSATIAGNPIFSAGDRLNYAIIGDLMTIHASSAIAFRIDVFSLTGERIFSSAGMGDRTYSLPKATAQGIALVRMKTALGNTLVKTVLGAVGN